VSNKRKRAIAAGGEIGLTKTGGNLSNDWHFSLKVQKVGTVIGGREAF